LKCTFVAPFAREDGVGAVETDAVVRPGAAVEWLDIKQKSTSCLVSKAS
jgi:hypothetical protein